MSIRKYIAYLRTVETGSITQAANELGYTQSAVSKMISDLEQDWQVKLLTRNHSGIEISSDGMVLLPTIREIVKDYEDLNFAVSELHGVQSGTLRLGCFTSLAISLLPEILKDFHQTYPNIQIQLMTASIMKFPNGCAAARSTAAFLPSRPPTTLRRRPSCTTRWSPFSQRITQWWTRPSFRSSSCRTRTSCA